MVDLGMADILLPLTNLSAHTTAALLDRAGALRGEKARLLLQLHQQLFCSGGLDRPEPEGAVRVPFGNVTMLVYKDNGEQGGERHM